MSLSLTRPFTGVMQVALSTVVPGAVDATFFLAHARANEVDGFRANYGDGTIVSYTPAQAFFLPGLGFGQVGHRYEGLSGTEGDLQISIVAFYAAGGLEVLRYSIYLNQNGTEDVSRGGGPANDFMWAGSGDDLLRGFGGDDQLRGGAGNDTLEGGAANDSLEGGSGDDLLHGGAGNDTVLGGAGHDVLNGNAGNDILRGEAGDDRLAGGAGLDILDGGAGNDTLFGGDGSDDLSGGDGDDRLYDGAGMDMLWGGFGADVLVLDADGARDIVLYTQQGEGGDRILGFEAGVDKVDLTFLFRFNDFEPLPASRVFIGEAPAIPPNAVFVHYDTRTGRLWADYDGAGGEAPELLATFVGQPALTQADLILV
jgi:hypothetical protein